VRAGFQTGPPKLRFQAFIAAWVRRVLKQVAVRELTSRAQYLLCPR
jgi:hypothetical protein